MRPTIMADQTPNPEILPPEPTGIMRSRFTPRQRIAIAGAFSFPLLGFILWAFNEFTSLRGVSSVLMSRAILASMGVAGVVSIIFIVWGLQAAYKKALVVSLSLLWHVVLVILDWWAPKPINPPTAEPCSIVVTPNSEIVSRVHLRAMWLPPPSHDTGVYKPIFQDLFHDWVINVVPTGTASKVIISIQDARKPVDNIRVEPSEGAIVSEPKPAWFSGFEEPSQTPDFYVRTVGFSTLDKPETISIRKPIKSHSGVNKITSLDLDLDRQLRASADKCKVSLAPLSTSISGTSPRFQKLIEELKALVAQKVSGKGFPTRLDPDQPYPPLAVNESEMVQELRCNSDPCKTFSVTMAVNPKKVVNVK